MHLDFYQLGEKNLVLLDFSSLRDRRKEGRQKSKGSSQRRYRHINIDTEQGLHGKTTCMPHLMSSISSKYSIKTSNFSIRNTFGQQPVEVEKILELKDPEIAEELVIFLKTLKLNLII